MTTTKPSDQLVDILKQIQARKTVKPEDATKALQQYYKVREHIRILKSEIELFKTQNNKDKLDNKDAQAKTQQTKGNKSAITSRNSLRNHINSVNQSSPASKAPSRTLNGLLQPPSKTVTGSSHMNGPVPARGTRLATKVSEEDGKNGKDGTVGKESKASEKQSSKKSAKDDKSKKVEKQQSVKEFPVKQTAQQTTKDDKSKKVENLQSVKEFPVKQTARQTTKDDKSKAEEKQPSVKDTSEKEKDSAKQRLQNVQSKIALDIKSNYQGSDNTPKVGILEQRDIPRQEKLVEEFKKLHDFEYRSAFHDLEKHYKLKDDNITELLAGIAKKNDQAMMKTLLSLHNKQRNEAYTFCLHTSKQQFDDMAKAHAHVVDVIVQPKYASQVRDTVTAKSKSMIDREGYQVTRRFLKDYRRAMARVPVVGLTEIFESVVQRDILGRHSSLRITPKAARPYIHRLIETNWYMSIHEPPMAQVWPRGGQLMNRDWFTPYDKKGATIIHTVWPALFYNKEGNIADKGICVVK